MSESEDNTNTSTMEVEQHLEVTKEPTSRVTSGIISEDQKLFTETKLLKGTLDLLWNKTLEQRKVCEQLKQENEYLQDYIDNLMTSSNVLDKSS